MKICIGTPAEVEQQANTLLKTKIIVKVGEIQVLTETKIALLIIYDE